MSVTPSLEPENIYLYQVIWKAASLDWFQVILENFLLKMYLENAAYCYNLYTNI